MQSTCKMFGLQKVVSADTCSADREGFGSYTAADVGFIVLTFTSRCTWPLWRLVVVDYFPPQGERCRYHVKEQPCTARGAFLMSWFEQMKWIPTSKPSPFFCEGKVAVASLTFTNESIHSTHTLICSLHFSYPALETALGISEKSQFLISFWQAVFYFQQQDLCMNNLLSSYWYQAVLRRLCWIESYRASGSK